MVVPLLAGTVPKAALGLSCSRLHGYGLHGIRRLSKFRRRLYTKVRKVRQTSQARTSGSTAPQAKAPSRVRGNDVFVHFAADSGRRTSATVGRTVAFTLIVVAFHSTPE